METERKVFWGQAFAAMATVWTWFEPTVLRILVWDDALSDISVPDLARGVSHVIRNHSGNQPPTPGEVRDAVQGELVKHAVKDDQGRIIRWERNRIKPAKAVALRLFGSPHLIAGRANAHHHESADAGNYED